MGEQTSGHEVLSADVSLSVRHLHAQRASLWVVLRSGTPLWTRCL